MQLRRPIFIDEHIRKRREWTDRYEHFIFEDWKRVKWTDECFIERGVGIQPTWTFLRPNEQLIYYNVKKIRCEKDVKKMFWANFSFNIRINLIPFDGDPLFVRGRVFGRTIRQLYTDYLPDLVGPEDIFIYDNAPVHTVCIVREILYELHIQMMIWPPYSPNLNPIENLWSIMKGEIYKIDPGLEHTSDTEGTLERLIAVAIQV